MAVRRLKVDRAGRAGVAERTGMTEKTGMAVQMVGG